MDSSQTSIEFLVKKIKKDMFSTTIDWYSFISPSWYDTAWLAMIPDRRHLDRPMFRKCLDLILRNQNEDGFWGDTDGHGLSSIDCLTATLACMVALKKWNVGADAIDKGLAFIHAKANKLLVETYDDFPRWFTIVFPAMLELKSEVGLEIVFSNQSKAVITNLIMDRRRLFEKEELVDKYQYPPLLSYVEALPSSYDIGQDDIVEHLSGDGSLFRSSSATAHTFMVTGNKKCLAYLQSLVQRCANGVPEMYPMDEDLIKLCIVNQIQSLGLAEHFIEEIDLILTQVYRNYMSQERPKINWAVQLYKDSLSFRLLRMHEYKVSPRSFCWFLHHEESLLLQIEKNYEYFSSVMLNVYRATDLMFSGEYELETARSFSRKLLEKTKLKRSTRAGNHVTYPEFHRLIENELTFPWIARLDHLDHRMWIEENYNNTLWMGKASFLRLSSLHNDLLILLAVKNYHYRQSIFKNELEGLKRWTKRWGLSDMGFGREKTTYCYFAIAAASSSVPAYSSDLRILIAKSAIIVTVADDFFDMEGSMNELNSLLNAVQRWDGKDLTGHGKTIFDALDDLVKEVAAKHLRQQGSDITKFLHEIWEETFTSWMKEAEWSRNGSTPSTEEYLETGMTSISTHTLVLPAAICFLKPSLENHKLLKTPPYETITKLLMVMTRLLNDIQGYEKEQEQGKSNYVMLYLKENPEVGADIEHSIGHVREILERKKIEFIEQVFMDGSNDLPKPFKHLHLSFLKIFHMFYNSGNRYDSNEAMLLDIGKAIHFPLEVEPSLKLKHDPISSISKKEVPRIIQARFINGSFKIQGRKTSDPRWGFSIISRDHGYGKMFTTSPKFRPCFI